jgi:hypothetical protein
MTERNGLVFIFLFALGLALSRVSCGHAPKSAGSFPANDLPQGDAARPALAPPVAPVLRPSAGGISSGGPPATMNADAPRPPATAHGAASDETRPADASSPPVTAYAPSGGSAGWQMPGAGSSRGPTAGGQASIPARSADAHAQASAPDRAAAAPPAVSAGSSSSAGAASAARAAARAAAGAAALGSAAPAPAAASAAGATAGFGGQTSVRTPGTALDLGALAGDSRSAGGGGSGSGGGASGGAGLSAAEPSSSPLGAGANGLAAKAKAKTGETATPSSVAVPNAPDIPGPDPVQIQPVVGQPSSEGQRQTGDTFASKPGGPQNVVTSILTSPTGGKAVVFTTKMAIDADGAGSRCQGDTTCQRQTALQYPNKTSLDAALIPYIVVPLDFGRAHPDVKLGDYAAVTYGGHTVISIVGDKGPAGVLGEASIATATGLGIPPSPTSGGVSGGVTYMILPNSRDATPPTDGKAMQPYGREKFKASGFEIK